MKTPQKKTLENSGQSNFSATKTKKFSDPTQSKYAGVSKGQLQAMQEFSSAIIADALTTPGSLREYKYQNEIPRLLRFCEKRGIKEIYQPLWEALNFYVLRNFKRMWLWDLKTDKNDPYSVLLIKSFVNRFNVCSFFYVF